VRVRVGVFTLLASADRPVGFSNPAESTDYPNE